MAYFIELIKGIIAKARFRSDSWQDFRDRHPAIARDLGAFVLALLLAALRVLYPVPSG